jgi:broad specificity phosphatase PhoE
MAGRVHLVRHGEVWNPDHVVYASLPGFGLSETGVSQAKEVGRYLRSAPIVAVWSSPLERAIATAEPIATHHDLPIRIDTELIEWKMADDWAGIRWDDLPGQRPGELEAYLAHPDDLPFASEALSALATRMRQAIASIAGRHDGDVVIVSHQDPVQAARLSLTGRDLARQQLDKPQHGTVITLKPGNPWTELTAWTPDQTPLSAEPGVDTEPEPEQLGVGLEGQ